MLKENQYELEQSNATTWHNSYTGRNIHAVVFDKKGSPHNHMKDYASAPFCKEDIISHATNVSQCIHEFSPNVKITMLYASKECEQWFKEHANEIDIVNISMSAPIELAEYNWGFLKDYNNIPVICASGNNSDKSKDGVRYPAAFDWTIAIGAFEEDGDIAEYSNGGSLDCLGFTDIYVLDSTKRPFRFDGTSASTPQVTGLLACYLQYLKDNKISYNREDIRTFIHNNCMDLGDKGFDYASGYGLLKLPSEIPKIEVKPTPIPTVIKASIETVKPSNTAIVTPETYIVKAGNSLSGISKKYGVSAVNIKKWNNLTSDLITVGQKLVLKQPLKQTFKDVSPSHSAYREIEEVYKLGLIDGFGDNFKPNDTITRAELAKIIYKIIKK